MPLADAGKNVMLDALAGVATHASLHTADPGTTGASEVTGGSPAYERQPVTWNTASGGNLDDSAVPTFNIPAGTTVTHFGLLTAGVGGTFLGGAALSAAEAFVAQGTYTLTDLDVSL